MSIQMIGIDHSMAPVDIRAIFSYTKKNAAAALEQLKNVDGISGALILSTCNRMEVWASTDEEFSADLVAMICEMKQVNSEDYRELFVRRREQEAVDHLFELTCGLKSRIIAEDQILTQVNDALALARENYAADNVLEILFRMAVTAAKRVKTEVAFSHGNETAVTQALSMLEMNGFSVKNRKCMVIGNGEMGKLAAQTLMERGADVCVTVRQYHSGVVQIPAGCKRINYGERYDYLPECELVVSATASPNCPLTRAGMEQIVLPEHIILIDIAVPRNIEKSVGELPGVELYDIDDFKISRLSPKIEQEIKQAEAILAEQKREFYDWYNGRDLIPRIQHIKDDAVNDLNLRIHKVIEKTPMEASDREMLQAAVTAAAGKVMLKLLFGLKGAMDEDVFAQCVGGLEKIYEEENHHRQP